MSKKEIINEINLIASQAISDLNFVLARRRRGFVCGEYLDGRIAGMNAAAGLLARRLGAASMIWDNPNPQRNNPVRYRGITDAARRLGVTRQHLFYVLKGERKSPTLLDRYRQYKKGDGK